MGRAVNWMRWNARPYRRWPSFLVRIIAAVGPLIASAHADLELYHRGAHGRG